MNDRIPRVSIIVPVYNGARFLRQSIESLFQQTFTDFEIIAVNDGSTDSSLDVLWRLRQSDSRLRIISRVNSGGPAAPRNDGMRAARGEYIGFLDCDDYIDPNHLRELVGGLDAHSEWIAVFHDL